MRRPRAKTVLILAAAASAVGFNARRSAAVDYTWVGPFDNSGPNLWSAGSSWSTGTVPASSPSTQLIFPGADSQVYTTVNDAGAPFVANNITYANWSVNALVTASFVGSGTVDSLSLSGASPAISVDGPSGATIGVFNSSGVTAYGLTLNPTSGFTTIGGAGTGTLVIGSATAGLNSSSGITVAGNGYQNVQFFSPATTAPNVVSGPVNLTGGVLYLQTNNAVGAAQVNVNGGYVRLATGLTVANNFAAGGTLNLVAAPSDTVSGVISGAGGVRLNGSYTGTTEVVTFTSANTYAGATVLDPAPPPVPNGLLSAAGTTLTLGAGGSIAQSAAVTVGTGDTLAVLAATANSGLSPAVALTSNGGTISITPTAAAATTSVPGPSLAGLTTLTFGTLSNAGGLVNNYNFGTPSLNGSPTLFFRGNWQGSTGSVVTGRATFAGGLPTAANPNPPANYKPVVALAAGTTTATGTAPTAFVTYNTAVGAVLIPVTDAAQVSQFSGLSGGFAGLPATDVYLNVNAATPTLAANAEVYALSNSVASTLNGSGQTLAVTGGAVVVGAPLTLNGPTLSFGSSTGYVHLPATSGLVDLSVKAGSITGTGGLVFSGTSTNFLSPVVVFSDQAGAGNTSNPFTGGLTINGGVQVQYSVDGQLGAAGGGIVIDGGSLYANASAGSVTLSRPITLGPAGGNLFVSSSVATNTFTVASNITGDGALYVNPGSLTSRTVFLSGTNTYVGPTYYTSDTLVVTADANLGSVTAPLYANGGKLQVNSSNVFFKPLYLLNGALIDTNGNSPTLASPITSVGVAGITGAATVVTKAGAGTLFLSANSPLLSNTLSVAAGTLSLTGNGAVPQIATTSVSAGATFQLDDTGTNLANRYPDAGRVTLAGGTLDLNGNAQAASSETVGGIGLSSAGTTLPNVVSVEPASATLQASGVVAGGTTYSSGGAANNRGSALTKAGAGTLVLRAANVLPLGVSVGAGTVLVAGPSALGFGVATDQSVGRTAVAAGGSLDLGGQTITEPVTLTGGSLVNTAAAPAVLTGGIKGVAFAFDATATAYNTTSGSGSVGGTLGSNFAPGDKLAFTGGTGAAAALTLGLTQAGLVIQNPGDYSAAVSSTVTVTIAGGGGTGATAKGTVDSNHNFVVTLTNPGSGYTGVPTVTIGADTGATSATVVVNPTGFGIVGLQQVNAGTGFSASAGVSVVNASGGASTGTFGGTLTPVAGTLTLGSNSSIGGAGDLTVGAVVTGPGGLVKIGGGTATLSAPNTYAGDTQVAAGTLVLASAGAFPAGTGLTVSPAAAAVLARLSSPSAVTVSDLAVGGRLDLNNNGLVVRGTASTPPQNLAAVTLLVKQGYANGSFNGPTGIVSTTASLDASHLTAVGVIANDDGNGNALYGANAGTISPTFEGATPSPGDVLVRYTYFGDANLDGQVDGQDYVRIDRGYASGGSLTGWYNGDFNYDGVVDGSDYTLIDNAFNLQGTRLSPAAQVATPAALVSTVAVPEPARAIAVALTLGAVTARRRTRSRPH